MLANILNRVSMSWVKRQQTGVWYHDQIVDGEAHIMFPDVGTYLRNIRITINGGKRIPFKASLQQASIPYWEQPENVEHVWRTPFLVAYVPDTMNVCYLEVQFPPHTMEKGAYSNYVIEWEASTTRPDNAFKLDFWNCKLPEPVAARL